MQELAAEAGMTRFRLTRAFLAAHGLPPHAYLHEAARCRNVGGRLARGEALTGSIQSHAQ